MKLNTWGPCTIAAPSLMASIGFANTAADPLERAGPYLVRSAADFVPTTKLLDDYRGMILCTLRNYHDVGPRIAQSLGGDNGFSLVTYGTVMGAGNDPPVSPAGWVPLGRARRRRLAIASRQALVAIL